MKSLKIKKVNIRSQKEPKFVIIGNYWDEETVSKVIELLHEYKELFPTNFLGMKALIVDLGVMKILHKPYVKLVKQRPYRLNLKYKEK